MGLFKSRKSSYDVDMAANVISGIMFVAILLAVLLLVIAIIFGLSVFSDNGINGTTDGIRDNVVDMVANFFALMPTVGTILAVVVLIAGIVLLVMYVSRMRNTGQGVGAGTYAG
jgi:vacuolar-type H+-ATPase subunit I/STV1